MSPQAQSNHAVALEEDAGGMLRRLSQHVESHLFSSTQFDLRCPPRLAEAIRYSLLSGGKRLRPALAILAAEACGGTLEAALPAASALEMIHCYSLIHDDLPAMDDDDLRRGQPTNHKVYGEAFAILAGDGLLTLAFEVLASGGLPAAGVAESVLTLAQAAGVCGMVGGQAEDVATAERIVAEGRFDPFDESAPAERRLEWLEGIHRRKTGALLRASLRLGAISAGAGEAARRSLDEYGWRLGLAFQIVDDLLDVEGEAAVVGKRVGKDVEAGKLTYPAVLGIGPSRKRAEVLIREAVEALAPFGPHGRRLGALARFVLERDR